MALPPELEGQFPGLVSAGYEQTSPQDPLYNCIGHAAGDTDWWQPLKGCYWPRRVPWDLSVTSLQKAFATVGYSTCGSGDLEDGVEKVAIFSKDNAVWEHAARQLPDGNWTSKIGTNEDISHQLHQLEGDEYGHVVAFMSRRRR
jgi:hypothetical protein